MVVNGEKCDDTDGNKGDYLLLITDEISLHKDSVQGAVSTDDIDPNNNHVILYPVGGGFNQKRQKQLYLENLLSLHWSGYSQVNTAMKKNYVMTNILTPIYKSGRKFFIHGPNGEVTEPSADVAFEKIAQKLRDKKKSELAKRCEILMYAASVKSERRTKREIAKTMTKTETDTEIRSSSKKRKSEHTTISKRKKKGISGRKNMSVPKNCGNFIPIPEPPEHLNVSLTGDINGDCARDNVAMADDDSFIDSDYIDDADDGCGETDNLVSKTRSSRVDGRSRHQNLPLDRDGKNQKSSVPGGNNDDVSVDRMQEIIWSQWEQINCWKRLCRQYRETYHVQRDVILQQDKLLLRVLNLSSSKRKM